MPYFFYSLLSLVLLTTGGVAVASDSVNPKKVHKYPPKFVQSYNQECMQTSMQEGLDKVEAKRLCDCTIKEFERQYSLIEFKRLTAASRTDKAAETTLIEVGQFCFEQILYEE
jgi:hypothetical protein